jgi:Protein of unknown function (DUF1091)
MRSGLSHLPMVSQIFGELANNGNAIPNCPINPGRYYIKAFSIERSELAGYFPVGKFQVFYKFFDENRKPFELMNFEFSIEKMSKGKRLI